jgi:hypothetical protein
VPRFVPLLRHPTCSPIGREVFVKRKPHRGEGADGIGQVIDMFDELFPSMAPRLATYVYCQLVWSAGRVLHGAPA